MDLKFCHDLTHKQELNYVTVRRWRFRMSKLIEMLRIGICPIGYFIMQESGLNLIGLVPGTRVDWIGLDWI